MGKSKYPQSYDTSREIPAVRDNILEIGSDTINSIRNALFNIERTLGINPQGVAGNTVAARLNALSDGSGVLKKEALTIAGVLSGPIIDADVSNVAAISESKLRLDFPTHLLQDEISIVSSDLNTLKDQIDELSTTIAAHVNASAVNRHKASAISVDSASGSSGTAVKLIEANNVQDALRDIYDRHINYSGADITSVNNSHTASQIFFDDSNSSALLSANDVQEAIEEVSLLTSRETIQHQDRMHGNGYLRNGSLYDATNSNIGLVLASDQDVGFSASSGESDGLSTITFDNPIELGDFSVERGDYLIISDPSDESLAFSGTYQISSTTISSGFLQSVEVFGYIHGGVTATTAVIIGKSVYQNQVAHGLILSARERATLTSSDIIQLSNPNSVAAISRWLKPSEITSANRYIVISIDGGSDITLDLYDGSSSRQSVDSVVKRINEQAVEGNYSFLSYVISSEETNQSEIAIILDRPNNSTYQHTIKVSSGTDSGIDAAGFTDGEIFSAQIGSLYFVNGKPLSSLRSKLSSTGLSFFAGNGIITSGGTSVDFISSDLKAGDIIIISGSTSDDGSYVISNVTSEILTISSDQVPSGFVGASTSDVLFEVYDSTVNLDKIIFDEVAESFGASVIEAFLDHEQNLIWSKRIEYQAEISGINPIFYIVDYDDSISDGDELTFTLENINSKTYASLDGGEKILLSGTDIYFWVSSSTRSLKVYVDDSDSLYSYIDSAGTISKSIYGYSKLNNLSNLLIGKIPFGSFNGRTGGGREYINPRIDSYLEKGSVSWNDLSTSARKNGVERPIEDLRSSGVISGLELLSCTIEGTLYKISTSSGVCYVNGSRKELFAQEIITDIDSASIDKFFVGVSEDGRIEFKKPGANCCDPFKSGNTVTISSVEYDGATPRIYDLRLFINELDLKLLNSISVSPVAGMGHFLSIPKALQYAKRFSELYPEAGVPTIQLKSGTHQEIIEIDESSLNFADWASALFSSPSATLTSFYTQLYDEGIFIDFPVNIIGEGESSIVEAISRYTFADGEIDFRGIMFIPGDGFTNISATNNVLNSGFVKLSNFKLKNTRLSLVDLNVETAGTTLNFGVDIDSLVFDFSDFTANVVDSTIGERAISISEDTDTTEFKGNISVRNSKFIECFTHFSDHNRLKNFRFSGNVLFGGGVVDYLLTDDIVSFLTLSDGSNIDIHSNYIADNFETLDSSSAPKISPSVRMSSRFESDLYLSGNMEAGGAVAGDSYAYNSTREANRVIPVDTLPEWGTGYPTIDGISGGMLYSSYNNGTRMVKTIHSPLDLTSYCTIRLPNILEGQTLTAVRVHYYTSSGNFDSYTINVYSEDFDFIQNLEDTVLANGVPRTATSGYANGTGISVSGGSGVSHYLRITRSTTTGAVQYISHISFTIETDSVEGIGGF